MCGRRDEVSYLRDMVAACERMVIFSAGVCDADLMALELPHRGAVLHQLIVLGEAAKHVSGETAAMRPDVPWADVARLRDKLVHYYHGLDDDLLLDIVRCSMPAVLPKLRMLLDELEAG
jgi:uncharacterized protein with HEPN domain